MIIQLHRKFAIRVFLFFFFVCVLFGLTNGTEKKVQKNKMMKAQINSLTIENQGLLKENAALQKAVPSLILSFFVFLFVFVLFVEKKINQKNEKKQNKKK